MEQPPGLGRASRATWSDEMSDADVKTKDDKGKGKGKDKITISVVVGGSPVKVKTNGDEQIQSVIPAALKKSGNLGQNPDDWELADKDGNPYDPNKTFDELGLEDGATIYLSRKAGGGG
jgi:hypothetical protein